MFNFFAKPRIDFRSARGLSLVELIVVVTIIGILSAIAVPIYLNQKKGAAESKTKSDLNNSAQYFSNIVVSEVPGTLPLVAASPLPGSYADAPPASSPVYLGVGTNGRDFCVGAKTSTGEVWYWDSIYGGYTQTKQTNCPTVP